MTTNLDRSTLSISTSDFGNGPEVQILKNNEKRQGFLFGSIFPAS